MDEGQDREFGRGGTICAMFNCYNYGTQKNSRSFFRFPTDSNLCAQWVLVSGRKDLSDRLETTGHRRLNKSHRYCSDHFSPTSFKNPKNHCQGLRKGTVPTLCLGNPNAIQQQSPEMVQIGGLDQQQSPEKVQISGLDKVCYIKPDHNRSPPPPILCTPPTLSQSPPVPDVGSTKPSREQMEQSMKILKLENHIKTLRLKLVTSQKLTSRLKMKGEIMKNEIKDLKREVLRNNENFIDVSPAAIGDNLLAALLRHGRKNPLGRRYTDSEKSFALELHRCSPKAYALVQKRLNLPTPRIIYRQLERQRKAVSSEIKLNASEDALSIAVASCIS